MLNSRNRKVYQIDQHNNIKQTYEVKPSSAQIAPFNGTHSPYLLMQFQYPKLEVTYEKAFLALDMVNTRFCVQSSRTF